MSLQFKASTVPLWANPFSTSSTIPQQGNTPWVESPMENTKLLHHGYHFLSILKEGCENYLFKDYRLKSGIAIWILTLRRGRNMQKGRANLTLPLFILKINTDLLNSVTR